MSNKLKTISDIIADHRQRAKEILGNGVYEDILEKEEAEDAALDHEIEADRIEAAYKRELGNAQKMREALQAIVDICDGNMGVPNERLSIYNLAKAALSAPPRNCDVGTPEEQVERHKEWCRRDIDYSHCCNDCRDCFARWAQMPYDKEAGNEDASKI